MMAIVRLTWNLIVQFFMAADILNDNINLNVIDVKWNLDKRACVSAIIVMVK